ncbi:NrfD/PsrC family molybdoenzyme membrane anchor subunit [Conexibacter arvalis]|uniref:Formate-dependent nitrite reductase membrane component NrfD n=1 Tax=Conexibacter arvalis TaxID=912552 RepID=A0A840IHK0_9ACTN|nr:NrfD/PsrC family molybdoenzyme membrane anchor subunit [Conexibacter arvalis]MBB4664256.1 formate-dependent nitrite reductase membrane component NrfD [Conexibacter arvalis]
MSDDRRDRPAERPEGPLDATPPPPAVRPEHEPPATSGGRERALAREHAGAGERDMTPAVGTRGEPAAWERASPAGEVALARRGWGDAAWSFLFGRDDTAYRVEPQPGEVAEANRRGRAAPMPETVQGPVMKPPVWTWEVPLYFWLGGVASGASFVALACDAAGDERSARTARAVALGAVGPAPLLLIADLGRPARFLNMLRIVKPRSPMNLGAWALVAFSALDGAAVGADLLGLRRTARALGGATAVVGGYLGSYTGVLLAATAVPLWARSRLLLGPIFVSTATATGAAATRLVLVARGLPEGHPTRLALGTLETGAMLTELGLSSLNERRLRHAAAAMTAGRPGLLFKLARGAVTTGLLLRLVRRPLGPRAHHVASALYLAGGLAFRYAWVEAGKASARDDLAVARMARGALTVEDVPGAPPHGRRLESRRRAVLRRGGGAAARGWSEAVRRISLAVERALPR